MGGGARSVMEGESIDASLTADFRDKEESKKRECISLLLAKSQAQLRFSVFTKGLFKPPSGVSK